jgi:hypothetical protein
MGVPRHPRPVKPFASVIFKDRRCFDACIPSLEKAIGPVEEVSAEMPFDHTSYYEEEMGSGLRRAFVLFKGLVEREGMHRLKVLTNGVEGLFLVSGKRVVNIDPGYIALEHVVLLTTKGYTHRIYLSQGIFADLTLVFERGSFRALPWTYPDYRGEHVITLFNGWRERYKLELRGAECSRA